MSGMEAVWAYCRALDARMNQGAGPVRPRPDDEKDGRR